MNILEVARDAKEIVAGQPVTCPCGEKWFSPFDKLYVKAYDKCTTCSDDEELERLGNNIFAIIEAL